VKNIGIYVFHFSKGKPDALIFTGIGIRFSCKRLDGACAEDENQRQECG
jgi:hypothetical protein